ncbi:11276_t:CDS:2 [Entrophospora sp. SA101]|nr:11276_t:CDS:2 [Entrophospora sp. SA101]
MVNTRNILLIGRTGSGKSTLANVLVGENKFIESAKSTSVTKQIEEGIIEIDLKEDGSEKIKYRVIDTIGLGDTQLTPQGVLSRVKREELREENPKLAHILNSVKVLYLDNPPLKGRNIEANKEIREESRKRLLTRLATCQGNYRPSNIDTLDKRVEEVRKEQEEKFRREMTELKEQQAKELKEMREKSERDIHNVKVEGEENLHKTKNEMTDAHRRDMVEHDRRNEEKVKELKNNYEQQAKSIKEDAERQRREAEERDRRNNERIDGLQKDLNEKSSSSNDKIIEMMQQQRIDDRIREDKREERENKRREAEKASENARRKEEQQAEAKRQEIERKRTRMDAA